MSLPTENKIDEWTRRSLKEGICGIVDCLNKPTVKKTMDDAKRESEAMVYKN